MDPRTRLGLLAAVGLLAVLLDRPAALLLLVAVAALPLLGASWTWRLRALGAAAAVMWSTMLSQGLFYGDVPRTPLLELGPVVVWREGLMWGLVQSLRFLSVTLAGIAVAVSTPPERLFAGLLALRVPYGIAFLGVTALRFVPVVGSELLVVRRARARRGRAPWARSPWKWLVLELSLLRPVVARSLRRAQTLAESLDARGFDPVRPRRLRHPLRMQWWEPVLLGLAALVVVGVTVLQLLYWTYVAEIAYVPALREVYGWVRMWL